MCFVVLTFLINIVKVCNICQLVLSFFYIGYYKLCFSVQMCTIMIDRKLLHMVFTIEGFFEVVIESWPEWDLNPQPLNFIQTL